VLDDGSWWVTPGATIEVRGHARHRSQQLAIDHPLLSGAGSPHCCSVSTQQHLSDLRVSLCLEKRLVRLLQGISAVQGHYRCSMRGELRGTQDKGYVGSSEAVFCLFKGRGEPQWKKDANPDHAKLRSPGIGLSPSSRTGTSYAGCGAARTGPERSPELCSSFNSEKQDEKGSLEASRARLRMTLHRALLVINLDSEKGSSIRTLTCTFSLEDLSLARRQCAH
jgi:hypothetical protein